MYDWTSNSLLSAKHVLNQTVYMHCCYYEKVLKKIKIITEQSSNRHSDNQQHTY